MTTSLPFLDVLALPAFYLLLPALAVAQLPLLHVERLERVPVYVGSMIAILTLGAVGALLASRLEGVAPAGMSALPTAELLLWTAGLVVGGLVVVAAFHPLDRRARGGAPEVLRDLIPRTPRERGLFGALSISAGVGEELAYRGYAFQVIQLLGLGPWGAALASSLPFGCLHAYQGPVGVVRTAVMGVVLAVPVVLTGSLLPSMAAHALLDIILGIVLGDRLMGGNGRGTERDDRSDLVPREHGE